MADFNQFGSAKPFQSSDAQHCAQCEAMLADALDGTLSAADQTIFDLHMIGCASCSAMLADARRGAAWMEMLKSPRPEPPTALLERILAETCGSSASASPETQAHSLRHPSTLIGRPTLVPPSGPMTQPAAAFGSAKVLPFRSRIASAFHLRSIGHTLLQPRLAMTAAMAFFSIALTLNLTGIRLSDIHASDFKPSSIMRSAYQAKARVVPASPAATTPDKKPSGDQPPDDQRPGSQNPSQNPEQKQARPRPKPGTSRRETPSGSLQFVGSGPARGPHPAATEAFVIFLPSVLKDIQEGGLV